MTDIQVKRVYDKPSRNDGRRILVDRIWPRGLSRDKAQVDEWVKDVAPSSELRRWFKHDPDKWPEFKNRYFSELDGNSDAVAALKDHCKAGKVTLVFGAKEERYNNAVALAEYLRRGTNK